jgi:hypothetical protein
MSASAFFEALQEADKITDLVAALADFESQHGDSLKWVPVGGKPNNSGIINVASDPGRSLVERLTNAVDGVLEREHELRNGTPDCRTPREAASAWLGIPNEGLSALTTRQRQQQANKVTIRLTSGEGRKEARTVEVRDAGIGISAARMPGTILSLNESNKWQKHYLAGTFGQGGSSTFAASGYTVIASRYGEEPHVGFTIVRYQDLPAAQYKTGHYVYLTTNQGILTADIALERFPRGTQAKHFGYDLSAYASPLGPSSLYGLLNQTLFDPILPVWLDSRVHNYRRVIKGSRNALNGAVDEGDDDATKSKLSHNVRMFYVTLGEFGQIGVEYWVLERPTKEAKHPIAAFVNPRRPIVLTLNGQNQDEMSNLLVRKESQLPYLAPRLICHIDCNQLTPEAKRLLFTSTREEGRSGIVRGMIQKEVVRIFLSDDELSRLNEEARRQGAQEQDKNAIQVMRKEVAKILQLQGLNVADAGGLEIGSGASEQSPKPPRPIPPPPPPPPVFPIPLRDPPTFVRFMWEKDEEITFYSEQRRYLRIETDADSRFHNPNSVSSPTNFIVSGSGISIKGSTPLQGVRMRLVIEADQQPKVGDVGTIRVEMTRPGLPVISDERVYAIIEVPPAKPSNNKLTLPPFELIPVEGPDDPRWIELQWPDNVESVASSAEMENGKLTIYFSTAFPRFAAPRAGLEARDPTKAMSFVERYKIWLAVHSFFMFRDQEMAAKNGTAEPQNEAEITFAENRDRDERCRTAALSALFSAREVSQMGLHFEGTE